MEELHKVSINEKEEVFIDGQSVKGLTAYKLENSADISEPAKLTITMYVSIGRAGFEPEL